MRNKSALRKLIKQRKLYGRVRNFDLYNGLHFGTVEAIKECNRILSNYLIKRI